MTNFNPLGLGKLARDKLAQLSGTAPAVCWLPSDSKATWEECAILEPLRSRRRPPMFITTTWHAPDPDNPDAMLHLADGVWIDIDIKDEYQTIDDAVKALSDTIDLMRALDIPLECCSLFASGGKGFHIFIPLALMVPGGVNDCGILTARVWPRLCQTFVMDKLLTDLTDYRIYSGGRGRLFRQAGVLRDNGAYKVQLKWCEWQALTPASYQIICSKPRPTIEAAPVAKPAIRAASAWLKALGTVTKKRPAPGKPQNAIKLGTGGNLLTTDKLKIETALKRLAGNLDYADWVRVGMALKSTGANDALELWVEHSKRHPKYRPGECESKWNKFGGSVGYGGKPVGLGTLFALAKSGGRA